MGRWTAADIPDLTGRTFLITGANSGLGFHTARHLAGHGGHVILTARDRARGTAALSKISEEHPKADLELRLLDLSDLDSVRSLAGELAGERIDVLVNNAGIMMPPRRLSKQGHESQFATNHLGHFALTGLLLDTLRASDDGRVVTVASTLHRRGSIHFDDLTGERSYSPTGFYAQSKFANILFGLELDRRLRASGSTLRSIMAHPGFSNTNLAVSGPTGITRAIMRLASPLFAQSAEQGALPQLYAATDPAAQSGQYIGPDGLGESRGHPTVVQPVAAAKDPETARRLWTLSETLTGVTYEGI